MKLDKAQWKIFWTLIFMGTIVNIDKSMISMTLLAFQKEFGWAPDQLSIILSVFYVSFILVTLIGGWVTDRYGYKKFVVSSLIVLAIFSILFGSVSSLLALAAFRLCVGFGQAAYTNGTPKILATNYSVEECSTVQPKILATAGVGGILAYTAATYVINLDWRYAYWGLGILYAVVLVMMLKYVPDKKPEIAPGTAQVSIFEAYKNRNVLLLAGGMMFNNMVAVGLLSWLPAIFQANFHMEDTTQIGYILTINSIVMTVAIVAAGTVINKFFKHKEKTFVLSASVIGSLMLLGFIYTSSLSLAIVLLYLVTILMMSIFTTLLILPYRLVESRIIGSAFAVINIGCFIGGMICPLIIGKLAAASGGSYTSGVIAFAVFFLLSGIVPLWLREKTAQKQELKNPVSAA